MQKLFFLLMIVFSILAVQTNILRRAIIYLGVFSLISSFTYLLYNAPDVAIAEAIIGSTLSTILFLVALKKYKIFRIYLTKTKGHHLSPHNNALINALKKFVIKEELELDVINTSHNLEEVLKLDDFDLIVEEKNDQLYIFGDGTNYHYENLQKYLQQEFTGPIVYNCLIAETGDDE